MWASADPILGQYLGGRINGGVYHSPNLALFTYSYGNPVTFSDPDGRSVWTKGAKFVANGFDVASTFADLAEDAATVFNPAAPASARIMAGLSILSEALPVSAHDVKDGAKLVEGAVDKIKSSGKGPDAKLPDDALVCRGGTCTAERFENASGASLDSAGNLQGVSVNSAPGKTVQELTTTIPNKQVGVTTVGEVRKAGGDVVPSPTRNNPDHCTLCGISPQKAEELFTPTVRNPNQ